ncbi:MAG: hypothetical protein QOG20_2586 [Pseudonocardiales bacterium]|jgi:hypothetical protein|nr:hypothetical protein [Pseudonocardiales bacterium]
MGRTSLRGLFFSTTGSPRTAAFMTVVVVTAVVVLAL